MGTVGPPCKHGPHTQGDRPWALTCHCRWMERRWTSASCHPPGPSSSSLSFPEVPHTAPQMGLLQWITNLAGRPWPALTAAGGDKTEAVSWVPLQSTRARCRAQAGSPAPARLPGPPDHLVQEGCSCLLPGDSHGSSSRKLLVLQSPPSVAGWGGGMPSQPPPLESWR